MSAARLRELADEAELFESHPTRYRHAYTVHQPYMGYLLEHILTTQEEMTPSNKTLYEEFQGRMRRRDDRIQIACYRAQQVDDALHLGFYNVDPYQGASHTTKKTWHRQRCAHDFKARCMPDGAHFTRQIRDILFHLSYRYQTLLTSSQIDRVEHFLASCLAEANEIAPLDNV